MSMKMTMAEFVGLEPCPFCGGEAEPFNPFGKVEGTWCVLCSECAAATGFEQTEAEAIAAWNTRATRGMLTAEQVRKAIERHSAWVIGNNRCFHDGAYEEIADELNAERHVGTCENMREKFGYKRLFVCSECGVTFDPDCEINYCPSCGRKVVNNAD